MDKPFSVTVDPELVKSDEMNVLAVRSHDSIGQADIFRAVYFIPRKK